MTREEAITVLKAFMDNPLFSDVHKSAFNIAIHDIKQRHDWDINKLMLVPKTEWEQEPTTKNDLSSGLENVSPIIDWNKCHTSEQLNSIATTKNDLGVDCISRADVLNHLANIAKVKAKSDAQKSLMGRCMFMVENIPSITPQEPKTGHWKYFQNEKGDWMNVCSNCNSDCGVGYPYNYCPNCGCRMESADMREVEE